jgi:hypothetical protein
MRVSFQAQPKFASMLWVAESFGIDKPSLTPYFFDHPGYPEDAVYLKPTDLKKTTVCLAENNHGIIAEQTTAIRERGGFSAFNDKVKAYLKGSDLLAAMQALSEVQCDRKRLKDTWLDHIIFEDHNRFSWVFGYPPTQADKQITGQDKNNIANARLRNLMTTYFTRGWPCLIDIRNNIFEGRTQITNFEKGWDAYERSHHRVPTAIQNAYYARQPV